MASPRRVGFLFAGMALALAGEFITKRFALLLPAQSPLRDTVLLVIEWGFSVLFMAALLTLIFSAFSFRHPFGVMSDE